MESISQSGATAARLVALISSIHGPGLQGLDYSYAPALAPAGPFLWPQLQNFPLGTANTGDDGKALVPHREDDRSFSLC